MSPSGHFPVPVKTPLSPASNWGTPREAFVMGEQRHLVGRLVLGAEARLSLVAFSLPWTHFSLKQLRRKHLKHFRFRTLDEDQTQVRQGLAASLTNIIHFLQVSDSISLPNAQLRSPHSSRESSLREPPPNTPRGALWQWQGS